MVVRVGWAVEGDLNEGCGRLDTFGKFTVVVCIMYILAGGSVATTIVVNVCWCTGVFPIQSPGSIPPPHITGVFPIFFF